MKHEIKMSFWDSVKVTLGVAFAKLLCTVVFLAVVATIIILMN